LRRLAAAEHGRSHGREHDRRQPLDATKPPDRADHHGPVGPQTGSGNKALTLTRS
jgi:hypothetical protein